MTQPIKIMHIIARLNIGGTTTHVVLLTQRLGAPTYASTLVSGVIGDDEGDMIYYAEERDVTPIIIPELGRSLHPVRDLLTLWKVYRLIREMQPDIVHTHTAKAGFIGRIAAWLARVPVITHTFHGHVFHGYFSPTMTRVFILLERLTAAMSDTVITMTESLRRELAEQYRIARRSKITVLPYGLDLDAFANATRGAGVFRRQHNIAPAAPLIGIVGRLVPVKNHELFLQAARIIQQQLPDARFALVGDGELRAELEARAEALGLREVCIFTGWVKAVEDVYADLDVNVISSVNEGAPTSVIESLVARCPVVGTAVGGLPDLLDGGALGALVPSGDADALAAAIIATLENPPDPENARRLLLHRFGIERLAQDLDQLYRALLNKKRRSRAHQASNNRRST